MSKLTDLIEKAKELNVQKNYSAVIELLPESTLEAHNNADLYAEISQAEYRLGNYKLSYKYADKACAINPNHPKALNYLANWHSDELSDYDHAIALYKKALSIDPTFDFPYIGLGSAYSSQKRFDEALDAFQNSLNVSPNDSKVYCAIGDVYEKKGDFESAIKNYKKAFELDSNSEYAAIS